MQVLPINSFFNQRSIANKPNNPENGNQPAFKTAQYRKVVAEAMERGCVSNENQVISLFERMLNAAVNMSGIRKVADSPIFNTRYTVFERLSALEHNESDKVLLQRNGKPILEINQNTVRFTGLDDNPSLYNNEDISFWVENAKYGLETSYDKYLFHYNGNLKKHIHYSRDYSSSSTEHFDKNGEPRGFRNFIEDVFGL